MIKFIIWFLTSAFVFFVSLVASHQYEAENQPTGSDLVMHLVDNENCQNPPCIYDQSLVGVSQQQLPDILENLKFLSIADLEIDGNRVSWNWSSATMLNLTKGKFDSVPPFSERNFVYFDRENKVVAMGLSFSMPFADLIRFYPTETLTIYGLFGERLLDERYAIVVDDQEGYFYFNVDCNIARVNEEIDIRGYGYERDLNFDQRGVVWEGYETQLPTCRDFPSG